MGSCCCCLGSSEPAYQAEPEFVRFAKKGKKCTVANFCVGGNGAALANSVLIQTRAYWEITVVEAGEWSVGVAKKNVNLEQSLSEQTSAPDAKREAVAWCLDSGPKGGKWKVDDVLGVGFDMGDVKPTLRFWRNGKPMKKHTITGIQGDVCPAVSVSGAMLEANFGQSKFKHGPPDNFARVMPTKDLI